MPEIEILENINWLHVCIGMILFNVTLFSTIIIHKLSRIIELLEADYNDYEENYEDDF